MNNPGLGALLVSEPVLQILRRELRRLSPDAKVETEEILSVLTNEVIKREVTEGDQAKEAAKKISRAAAKILRAKKPKESGAEESVSEEVIETEPQVAMADASGANQGE